MSEWISVEERLPEIKRHHVSDVALVYCAKQRVTALSELEETFFGGFVFDVERFDEDEDEALEVTHWMPLPEPPKEETT